MSGDALGGGGAHIAQAQGEVVQPFAQLDAATAATLVDIHKRCRPGTRRELLRHDQPQAVTSLLFSQRVAGIGQLLLDTVGIFTRALARNHIQRFA